jgi:hypothetical protein
MVTIGDKKLIYSETFLVADNTDVLIDVPSPTGGASMPFLVRFKPTNTGERTANWRTEEGRAIIEFSGWNNPLGTSFSSPARFGDLDGQPVGVQITNRYINGLNLVHFFLFQGGSYA